jgi:ubiquitin-activating enzyme E1
MATLGAEAMAKILKMRVLLHGLRGVGIETAKNIILAGPAAVTIHDDSIAEIADLGVNFYLTQNDVGKTTRSEGSVAQLKELNPNVKVTVYKASFC